MAVRSAPRRANARAERAGARVERNAGFPWLARAGLVARGVVYGVIGAIALEVALGTGARPTDQQGALETIARQPLGSLLLGVLAAGLAGYSAWRLIRAATGRGREESDTAFDRVAGVASGLSYAALCAVAVEILAAAGGGSGSTSGQTAGVLAWPAGRELVVAAGAVLGGVGAYQAYKGLAKKFVESSRTGEMERGVRRAYEGLGVFGHLARGIVFALVGYGLIRAAIDYEPGRAGGLDGALRELARASYGPALLGAVALGLIAFAAYSVADARYRKV